MTKELFTRYLNNKCSANEVEVVISWLKGTTELPEKRNILQEFWNEKSDLNDIDNVSYDTILDKIHHKINIENIEPKITTLSRSSKIYRLISKVAAILFIPLFAYTFYTSVLKEDKNDKSPIYTEIHAPNGSRTSFDLPDGSKVWLNSGSSLRFPERFSGKHRNVELMGEAYFDVKHNSRKPLVVKASNIHVMVHGTKFNVMNYKNLDIEVTLLSGSVSLNSKSEKDNYSEILKLKPSEQAIYSQYSNEISYEAVNANKYIAWTEGTIIFENDPLSKVVQHLGRSFNVDIIIEDKEIADYTFTATFVDENLPQVLKLLKLAMPIEYKIIKSKKQSDGTFTKTKISIMKN